MKRKFIEIPKKVTTIIMTLTNEDKSKSQNKDISKAEYKKLFLQEEPSQEDSTYTGSTEEATNDSLTSNQSSIANILKEYYTLRPKTLVISAESSSFSNTGVNTNTSHSSLLSSLSGEDSGSDSSLLSGEDSSSDSIV